MSNYRDLRDQFSAGERTLIDAAINYDGPGFGVSLGYNTNKDGTYTGWVMTYSGTRYLNGPPAATATEAMILVVADYSRDGLKNAVDPLARRA